MATESFTSSSANIFKQSFIFGIYIIMLIIGTQRLSDYKVIKMMKDYDPSVKINHNLTILIES